MTFTGVNLACEEQVWMGSGRGEVEDGREVEGGDLKSVNTGSSLTPALVAGFCKRAGGMWLQVREQV